ncbi:SDR family NAD(P)-dependent oxidoreductase [Streptomyces sp. cg40]|uniref:SDR family NAD(P)-dependent oxidoreductase n=1 Tax=Streptomyces sp. cg40 TaxID=3419764 RepID=UPI003CFCE403
MTPRESDEDGLRGRVALVTGGAGAGIGSAIVERLRCAGASLVVTDISAKRVEALRSRLGDLAVEHLCEPMDVRDEDAVVSLFGRVRDEFGRLDILVNSAGFNKPASLADMDLATWHAVLDTNVTSAFLHIREAWPLLRERGGAIVNLSSVAAWSGTGLGEAHYAAAKAGVLGLTRAAAAEGAPHGIRVNAVAPGLIWNEHLGRAVPPPFLAAYRAMSLMGQGQPEDVADVVHFLCTDASRHVTADTITVAGGHLARH